MNEASDKPLTVEEKIQLFGHHASEMKRLAMELGRNPEAGAFDDIEFAPASSEMHTARDSPAVTKAMASVKVATAELTTVETIVGLLDFVGDQVGFAVL